VSTIGKRCIHMIGRIKKFLNDLFAGERGEHSVTLEYEGGQILPPPPGQDERATRGMKEYLDRMDRVRIAFGGGKN
jgi:hypothetical protein